MGVLGREPLFFSFKVLLQIGAEPRIKRLNGGVEYFRKPDGVYEVGELLAFLPVGDRRGIFVLHKPPDFLLT